MTQAPETVEDRLTRIAQGVGFSSWWILLFLVPLAVPPPSIFKVFTVTSEIIIAKTFVIRFCSVLIVIAASFSVLRSSRRTWQFGPAALPMAFLVACLTTLVLSAAFSSASAYSFRESYTEISLILATLCASFSITTVRRARALLLATVLSALGVALVGLITRFLHGGIMEFLYGNNPFEILIGGSSDIDKVEGGLTRGPFMATLANTEFAGGFMALGFLLAGSWLMDGWGTARHRNPFLWLFGTGVFATLGLAIILSATRGALIIIAAGLIARWLAALRLRSLTICLGLCSVVGTAMVLGIEVAILVGLLELIGVLVYQIRTGQFGPLWKGIVWGTRALLVAGVLMGSLMIAAAAIPGPWQKGSLFLVERLSHTESIASRSVRERVVFYMLAAGMVSEHPVFGVGPGLYAGNYHRQLARLSTEDETGVMEWCHYLLETLYARQTHNDYFQIASERGLPALAFFLGLMSALLLALGRITRGAFRDGAGPVSHALLTMFCGFLANMLTSFPLFEMSRLATFYGMLACAIGLVRLAERNPDETVPESVSPS